MFIFNGEKKIYKSNANIGDLLLLKPKNGFFGTAFLKIFATLKSVRPRKLFPEPILTKPKKGRTIL